MRQLIADIQPDRTTPDIWKALVVDDAGDFVLVTAGPVSLTKQLSDTAAVEAAHELFAGLVAQAIARDRSQDKAQAKMSKAQASVVHAYPLLWGIVQPDSARGLAAARMAKQAAAPTDEAILARVDARVAKVATWTRDDGWFQLLTETKDTPEHRAIEKAYYRYQTGQGVKDRALAAIAKTEEPDIFSTAAALRDPRGVVQYVESLVRTLALTLALSDDEVMQRLKAKAPGLHAEYVRAKNIVPALPAGAPTAV